LSNSRPFTDAHAIASFEVAVLFSETMSGERKAELAKELQRPFRALDLVRIRPGRNGRLGFQRLDDAGEVIEQVHINNGFVVAIWNEYRGWRTARDGAISLLGPIFSKLQKEELPGHGLGVAFRDIFFNDDPLSYSPEELFKKDSAYIPSIVFSNKQSFFWKSSNSWYAKKGVDSKFLLNSQLSIVAQVKNKNDVKGELNFEEARHSTEVLHRQSIFFAQEPDSQSKFAWGLDDIRSAMDILRDENKDILSEILQDEMASQIGLKE